MISEEALANSSNLISKLLDEKLAQECMGKAYDEIITLYHTEMSKFLKEIEVAPSSAKSVRFTKRPYWTEELSISWKQYYEAERVYLNTKADDPNLVNVRTKFRETHNSFTKLYKKNRRAHCWIGEM